MGGVGAASAQRGTSHPADLPDHRVALFARSLDSFVAAIITTALRCVWKEACGIAPVMQIHGTKIRGFGER